MDDLDVKIQEAVANFINNPFNTPRDPDPMFDHEIEKLEDQAKLEEVLRRMEMGLGIQ